MTELEKSFFQCQKQDFLSYLVLPLLKMYPSMIGDGYFRTYLTFSGKIVVAASAVNESFKFYMHPEYILSFKESDKIYIVFNHPKQYEQSIISIMSGEYSKISSEALGLIRIYSGLIFKVLTNMGNFKTHPILEGILKMERLRVALEKVGLDYKGEYLPPLNLYEDLLDLDTVN